MFEPESRSGWQLGRVRRLRTPLLVRAIGQMVAARLRAQLHRADEWQQRHHVVAFPVAVIRKFGDDGGGSLAALVVGIVGSAWAGMAVMTSVQSAMDEVCDVPRRERSAWLARVGGGSSR